MKLTALLILTLLCLTVNSAIAEEQTPERDDNIITSGQNYTLTKAGLLYEVLKPGEGAPITAGRTAKVHYVGWLVDGTKFDSSVDRGEPFKFPLGAGRVIKGWDEGVQGMKIGEQRKLVIPPSLGYGARGAGNTIPPNSILIFFVELLGIE